MKVVITIFLLLFFISCNSNKKSITQTNSIFGEVKPPEICTDDTKKYFVYNMMHDSYLWSEDTKELTFIELRELKTDKEVLDELKFSRDKFSYILTKKEYNDFFQAGVNSGYGFFPSLIEDDNGTLYINIDFVYPNTPATKIGLKRGDLIKSIDGVSVTDLYNENLLNKKVFDSNSMQIVLDDLSQKIISKENYDLSTVIYKTIIEQDEKKIGYFVFQSFISISYKELNNTFLYFKSHGVDELILDLRYNGGGYIDVSNYLSSLIGGKYIKGKVFNREKYNDKYSSFDSIDYFKKDLKNALNLSRVFIITTSSSCSASELVINSLKSSDIGIDVIQIGSATCGKPYGMIGGSYCDMYIMPVQFKNVNGDGIGDYVDGIMPQCSAIDDISRDFGDIDEGSLSSALFFVKNETCKKIARQRVKTKKNLVKGFDKIYGLF